MDINTLYRLFLDSTGVTTDSRHCPAGSVFFALRGETFDGNAFAAQALKDGCAYAVSIIVTVNNYFFFVINGLLYSFGSLFHPRHNKRIAKTQSIRM